MQIAIFGTGYVGLVTGVCLAQMGHNIICIDTDNKKVSNMKKGIPSFHEPGLSNLMVENIKKGRLRFTTSYEEALEIAEIVYIAVGTPNKKSGLTNKKYLEQVALGIAKYAKRNLIVVIKSTVPVGTNDCRAIF